MKTTGKPANAKWLTVVFAGDFVEIALPDGSSTSCRSDVPDISLPLGEVVGVGISVSGPARCALYCKDYSGCTAFNYRSQMLADGTQCQLYTTTAGLYETNVADCRHYKVRFPALFAASRYVVVSRSGAICYLKVILIFLTGNTFLTKDYNSVSLIAMIRVRLVVSHREVRSSHNSRTI